MKACRGCMDVFLYLNFAFRWGREWSASLYPLGKSSWYSLSRLLAASQIWSGHFGEEQNLPTCKMYVVMSGVTGIMAKHATLCMSWEFDSSVFEDSIPPGYDGAFYLLRTDFWCWTKFGVMCWLCLFAVKLLLMSRPSSLLVTTTLIVLLPQPICMCCFCCCLHSNLSEIILNIVQV